MWRFRHLIHGSPVGPPVLFIHPFGTYFDEVRFAWIIEFFSDYRFIAMDVRGHGRSGKPGKPEDYGLNLVEDVERLLDHLKLAAEPSVTRLHAAESNVCDWLVFLSEETFGCGYTQKM